MRAKQGNSPQCWVSQRFSMTVTAFWHTHMPTGLLAHPVPSQALKCQPQKWEGERIKAIAQKHNLLDLGPRIVLREKLMQEATFGKWKRTELREDWQKAKDPGGDHPSHFRWAIVVQNQELNVSWLLNTKKKKTPNSTFESEKNLI